MDFKESINLISEVLRATGTIIHTDCYDGIIVKKLEASNTLDENRTSNQTHIAITGNQMDIFPYLYSDGYFNKSDTTLKKYFIMQAPVFIYKSNVKYLDSNNQDITFLTDKKESNISIVRSKRKQQADQIQLSLINFDGNDFVAFRKMIHIGSFLVFLKLKQKFSYDVFGVIPDKQISGDGGIGILNNKFYKLSTNTLVNTKNCIRDVEKTEFILNEEENKKHFRAWLGEQLIPKSDTASKRHYTSQEIYDYVNTLNNVIVTLNGKEYSVFATNDIEKIAAAKNAENKDTLDVYCNYLAYSKKGILENAQIKEFFKHNRILFGAPGTGKSYLLNKECESSFAPCQYERVTFYPSYTYAKFFGSYKPVNGENGIEYKFVPGPFVRVWIKAMTDPHHSYLLIIDEINRAEVATVFGDVFQLLDRTEGRSTYDIDISEELKQYLDQEDLPMAQESKMYIPDNMFIWATMNSADQGVYPVDTAFKRRWDFEYISLNANEKSLNTNEFTIKTADEIQKFRWNDVRNAINTWLSKKGVNEDKLMGPFFLSAAIVGTDADEDKYDENFIKSFKHKVLMYLFDDAGKPKRRELFAGVGEDNNRYSTIIEAFTKKGVRIFNNDIFKQMNVTIIADAESSEEQEP